MPPLVVAALLALFGRRRSGGVALKPAVHHVAVVLLAPQHAGKRLALDVAHVVGHLERRHARVERVRFLLALIESGVEARFQRQAQAARIAQAQTDHAVSPEPTTRT
jgi:hypothetical protein